MDNMIYVLLGMAIGGWITIMVILHAMTNKNDDSKVNGYYRDDD